MRDRLEILRRLLSDDGSLWVSLDDNEAHYFRVLADEVFGRSCFIANCVWQKRYGPDTRIAISDAHEHLFCYAVHPKLFAAERNMLPLTEVQTKQFRNPDNDPKGPWKADNFTAAGFRPNQMYEIKLPSGRVVTPPEGRCWRVTQPGFEKFTEEGLMHYGVSGDSLPAVKRYLADMPGMVPWTWWPHTEVGHSQEGKKESQALFGRDNAFSTPKPERLLQRVLHIATNPGDIVLDSFAGSGTTGAVAHKMGRRWIMVELGDHCHTHVIPRLKSVIDNEDAGGVTKAASWQGGGGFRYFTLAPSLLEKDQFDNWIINKKYNAELLTQAICKLEGFTYAPSGSVYWQHGAYWQHGHSTESDFIYVTTQNLTRQQIEALSEEVGPNRSLLVFCSAYRIKNIDEFTNLTLRKIPKAVLTKCEWGKDDYSLEIKNLAPAPDPEPKDDPPPPPRPRSRHRGRRRNDDGQATLFAEEGGDE